LPAHGSREDIRRLTLQKVAPHEQKMALTFRRFAAAWMLGSAAPLPISQRSLDYSRSMSFFGSFEKDHPRTFVPEVLATTRRQLG